MKHAIMAAINSGGGDLVDALIWLIGIGLICGLFWWLVDYVALPAPFNKVAKVIVALVAVIVLVRLIMRLTGSSL